VTLANPVCHFLVMVKGIFLKDLPATDVLRSLWPLTAITFLTLTAATLAFRHRLE